jgi:TetR/AcrR family transcriptional regulator, cholesterol catabolism regulator
MIIAEPLPDLGDPLPTGATAIQARLAEAAIELFYERGALATTVRDITSACGLTPGALYNHFASKDHLLYLVVRDIHRQVDDQLAALLAATDDHPVTQLATAVRFLVSHTAGFKKRSRVANREFTLLTGSRRLEITAIRRRMRDRFAGIILAGAQQGLFSLVGGEDIAAATMHAATITTMCVHISEWTLENAQLTVTALQDRYAELALRMVGAHERLSGSGDPSP